MNEKKLPSSSSIHSLRPLTCPSCAGPKHMMRITCKKCYESGCCPVCKSKKEKENAKMCQICWKEYKKHGKRVAKTYSQYIRLKLGNITEEAEAQEQLNRIEEQNKKILSILGMERFRVTDTIVSETDLIHFDVEDPIDTKNQKN